MNKLFARQCKQATNASGEVDLDLLGELIAGAYDQTERDRRRTDRSISLMIDELDRLNRGLERLVEERTAALRDRESRLAEQNLLIDAALNNMSQALLMFDAEARLVICNNRYLELYKMSPEVVKPGCALRELIEHRQAVGTFSGDIDEYCRSVIADVAKGKTTSRIVELSDGRAVHAVNRPMAGGGWVATHEDISERRHAEKQIAHMAHHDALTDLPNRVLLQDRLAEAERNRPDGERFAVFYLDLDNFKGVNDTLGHQLGDELLKTVADRLRQCVPDHVTVARVGGDEFSIIMPNLVHLNDAAVLAQHICESIREPYELFGQVVAIDTSIGIAIAPDDGIAPDQLMKNADMALYRAKDDGRRTYRFFEPAMDASVKARRSLESALRTAATQGEFTLHYQPILDLNKNRISCCEALIRWQHPERGMVLPADFIPVAEDIGLIVQIGEWVLRKACADAASWPDDIKVAVNLSPIQMMNANLMPVVIGALAAAGLPATRLELEITETVMMQNTEATLAKLHQLRELGVRISMDDFGTGYSSLSYLRSFPFDKLKIDRCFISDLSQADDALAIVRAVTAMTKSLGMITTAEGVETKEQMTQVRMLGCTEVQGYYIGRPQPLEQVTQLIAADPPRRAKIA